MPLKKKELAQKIEETILKFVDDPSDFTFDLDKWKLEIRIKGPKWKGVVDKPIANFVLDLDQRLTAELKRQGVILPKSDHGIVAMRVDKGSTLAFFEGVPETINAIKGLPPQQQMLVFIAILFAAGIWGTKEIIESIQRTRREKITSDERVKVIEAFTKRETLLELQAPLRTFVNKMDDSDSITLPATDEALSKKRLKEEFQKSSRSKPRTFYIDGAYTVEAITTKDPDHWKISVKYGTFGFVAELNLSEDDVQSLLVNFQEAHKKNTRIAPYLHVTADISEKGIQKATVVGLGKKRPTSVTLGDAFKRVGFSPGSMDTAEIA